jgi:uncharacterized membrane protein
MPNRRARYELLPLWLMLLMAIPVIAGLARIYSLVTGVAISPDDIRFFEAPLPVALHVVGACIYAVLGALQLTPSFRRRFPRWHRRAGRVLIIAGLTVALSGIWMTLLYPLSALQGPLLFWTRLVLGAAMAGWLAQGYVSARRRDFATHSAAMIRAYAVGLGAGTQALTQLPYFLIFGRPDQPTLDAMMLGAWLINLAIAEWVIRAARPGRTPAALSSLP